jgi:hypothetical protein
MQIQWSKTIEQFAPKFGISKPQIEDAFNKPDATYTIGGNYITIKYYSGYAVLITFFMQGNRVNFMNAYKIFPDMIKIDVNKANPLEILVDFMNGFGMEVDVPGVGKVRTFVDEATRNFFQGILDVEKYVGAANGRF